MNKKTETYYINLVQDCNHDYAELGDHDVRGVDLSAIFRRLAAAGIKLGHCLYDGMFLQWDSATNWPTKEESRAVLNDEWKEHNPFGRGRTAHYGNISRQTHRRLVLEDVATYFTPQNDTARREALKRFNAWAQGNNQCPYSLADHNDRYNAEFDERAHELTPPITLEEVRETAKRMKLGKPAEFGSMKWWDNWAE